MKSDARILELDGIRGLAILMVLVCHFFQNQMATLRTPAAIYLSKALSLTWSGVDLFFVLSGFLICGILFDKRDSPDFFKTFYLRRTCRIFPLYFLVLGIFILLAGRISVPLLFDNAMPLWTYATFTQNFAMIPYTEGTAYWLGATWSLAVEEQFYLLLPLIVFFAPRRALLPICVAGILLAVGLRMFWPGHHAYLLMPWRADSLLFGAVLALLVREERFMEWVKVRRRGLLIVFFVLLAGAAAMTAKPWAPWARNHFWLAALFSVFLLVALTNAVPLLNRTLRSRFLVWMGAISYGVYLLHGAVLGLSHWWIGAKTPQIQTWRDFFITLLAAFFTLALATLSLTHFERPILQFGQRFKYRKSELQQTR